MNAQGVIDQAIYNDLKDVMGADFIVELIDTFNIETEGLINQLRGALDAGDAASFGRLAHSIKSSSASLGALAFSQQARDLEMLGKSGSLDGAEPLVERFSADFLIVKQALEDLKNVP
jgi:two-component system, sensor histidine kinase and response regulator